LFGLNGGLGVGGSKDNDGGLEDGSGFVGGLWLAGGGGLWGWLVWIQWPARW